MYKALNPGMVHLDVPFESACRLAGEYGFGALEWTPLEAIEKHGLLGAQDSMGKYGVIIGSFGLPVNVQQGDAQFQESFPALERHAKAARDLGVHRSCTWIPSWSDELTYQQYYGELKARLRACAEVYGEHGIRLGLEFLGPKALYQGKKTEFIHSLDDMLELCADIGTGNVGILFDVYHAYAAGMDMRTCLRAFQREEQIVVVHINDALKGQPLDALPDSPRYLPGEGGGIDLKVFFEALTEKRYTGPVIVEPFSETLKALENPDEIMQALAVAVEEVWPAGD